MRISRACVVSRRTEAPTGKRDTRRPANLWRRNLSNKTLHVCCKVDDDDERQAESYVDRLYEEFSDLVIHIEPDKWEIPDSMISDEQKNA